MYYNVRWYDPTIARFAQADTIVPDGVQGYDRFAYASNNPVRYNDPSGHYVCEGTDACEHSTTIESQELAQKRHQNQNHQKAQQLIDNASYEVDTASAIVAYGNMLITDVTMAIIAGAGCATVAACPPALGEALQMDFLMAAVTPQGALENFLGTASTLLAASGDVLNGTTYVSSDGSSLNIGIGRDTVVAATNAARGSIPEVNYDAYVNSQQLRYDNSRRSGVLPPTTQLKLGIPLDWLFSTSIRMLG